MRLRSDAAPPGLLFRVTVLRSLSAPKFSFRDESPSVRRRAVSLVMAIAITLLIIAGFLGLNGSVPERPRFKGGPLTINLTPDQDAKVDQSKSQQPTKKQSAVTPPAARVPPPPPPPPPPIQLPSKAPATPEYILLTKEQYQAFDFTKIGSAAKAAQGNQPGAQTALGNGAAPGDSKAIGTAPDGEPLYAAQWYRRPTQAELSTYMPRVMPPGGGTGLIACKTVARYHVDDCVELGSSPPGSHLAGAARQAAWQFLVRPPRVGGKELVGTWVRIRIDYLIEKQGAKSDDKDGEPGGADDDRP